MKNDKFLMQHLDGILGKKKELDDSIQKCEHQINTLLSSLSESDPCHSDETPSKEHENPVSDPSEPRNNLFLGVDLSDDDALDQAVLNSNPYTQPIVPAVPDNGLQDVQSFQSGKPSSLTAHNYDEEDADDTEPLTLSKILGRTTPYSLDTQGKSLVSDPLTESGLVNPSASVNSDLTTEFTKVSGQPIPTGVPTPPPSLNNETDLSAHTAVIDDVTEERKPLTSNNGKGTAKKNKSPKNKSPKQKKNASKDVSPLKKLSLINIVSPLSCFFVGMLFLVTFLILYVPEFVRLDYGVLVALSICLILTMVVPYGVSVFFTLALLGAYVLYSAYEVLYLDAAFPSLYRLGWIIIIPLILFSSALLIRRLRDLFSVKRNLEQKNATYDKLKARAGLTTDKAYYKDLKYAMERASRGETTLILEMITIVHLEKYKTLNGVQLWDEILYKTLKVIDASINANHSIYFPDGKIFNIIMENTWDQDQELINLKITDSFKEIIAEYDIIEVDVQLKIASVPYTRDIVDPLDYHDAVLKRLNR